MVQESKSGRMNAYWESSYSCCILCYLSGGGSWLTCRDGLPRGQIRGNKSILCHLDAIGCASLLRELRHLQLVQNTAAGIVTLTEKTEHIKPILENLHWLPGKDCTDHKILSMVHNCFSGTGPQYLQDLIPCYEPLQSCQSSQSCLCIANVDDNHTKSSLVSGFSPSLPPDSEMPSHRCWENLKLLQLFTGISTSLAFKSVNRTTIQLLTFSMLVFSIVYYLANTLSQYAPREGLFHKCLGVLPIDNHYHYHHQLGFVLLMLRVGCLVYYCVDWL